ncbi:ThiF family adenylyltransferase [Ectopseudomonas oleovorans]|nr:ThiF family adenylyltransferase [Pseudomonas indoloxydans]
MGDQFRGFDDAEDIPGSALEFPRSRALYEAVGLHRDYLLVETYRKKSPLGEPAQEILVVDVSCDGVPPSNSVGIDFTERLALCVPKDPQALIEVLALRRGFPLLMHQNSILPDAAPSLCLYQEPPRSVARTWTAPSFLKRIQYWLEHSARGTLHAADQPVEQLFFVSPFELVLPWNFDALRDNPNMYFWVARGLDRPGGGVTLFLEGSTTAKAERTASVVNLTLPKVVHGRVESDCGTLGQLADALSAKGINLLDELTSAVQARVTPGIEASKDDPQTVLMLHVPVCRAEGEYPSKVVQRAYLIKTGILKLGEALGALYTLKQQDNVTRYYEELKTGFSAPPAKAEWRGQSVFPMEVLRCVDRAAARFQSGVAPEGPSGTLVGAGALGSALLDMWTRSGWGEWSIIDNDHIKPHNLVRHQADSSLIGASKAEAAVIQVDRVMQGATKAKAIHADACDLSEQKSVEALQSSTLVVDASTTLDYPRLASSRDDVGRHVSVFVTPSASAAVLLLEDANRKLRLRTLEAQYYRSMLSEEWGRNHLDGNLGSYWSGASCRDISLVMPYSNILGHAATIADQVPRLSLSAEAAIRVWTKDPVSGSIAAHSIEVRDELHLPFDGLGLFIDAGVRDKMSAFRKKQLPNETGGILLGYHDFNVNSIVVVDALPAPRDSKASPGAFERGLEGVIDAVVDAGKRTAGIVRYIGEWHSHPRGYSATPSGDDKYQLAYLTLGLAMEGLPAVMLIIGDDDMCALQGLAG